MQRFRRSYKKIHRVKIALITANIGGIDEVTAPVHQTEDYEFFYYTENTLPFPLPNLDNRMKGKYLKTQSHRFLNHDLLIWIDGSVRIKDGTFLTWILNNIKNSDIVICKHFDRNNVYEEIECISEHMTKGSKYLIERYAKQPFQQEYDFYLKEGLPRDYPLFNCWFFARKNNERVNKIFDDWWDLTLRYT